MRFCRAASVGACLACGIARLPASATGDEMTVNLRVDPAVDRHPIRPEIYGVMFASAADLRADGTTVNRQGGNYATRYNWELNASNHGRPFYLSQREPGGDAPAALLDAIVANSRLAGAEPMITIPIDGWAAKLGPGGAPLWSYSVAKYGPQTSRGEGSFSDAGNGFRANSGVPVSNNDPDDANQRVTPEFQRGMVEHLVRRWGRAAQGGVRYYLMDNEPSIWWANHGDVMKAGASAAELRDDIVAYASMVRRVDPTALICGPEEWGWSAFFRSGMDQQWGDVQKSAHGGLLPAGAAYPDKARRGGMDYMPWLLQQLHSREVSTGTKLLDVFTFHCYPAGGEFSDDVSPGMQHRRNRSTRMLWDTTYRDPSWINDVPKWIPRMRELVREYDPGLRIGITEYDWGAVDHINGATAQADVLGIFGREGLDVAVREQIGIHGVDGREGLDPFRRWTPDPGSTLVDKAFQMYRNYDGRGSTFGDTSVRAVCSEDPDRLSAFAAQRSTDGVLTVMIVAKDPDSAARIDLQFTGIATNGFAELWQLTAANRICRMPDVSVANGRLQFHTPAQSVTLVVLARTPGSPGSHPG